MPFPSDHASRGPSNAPKQTGSSVLCSVSSQCSEASIYFNCCSEVSSRPGSDFCASLEASNDALICHHGL